MPKRFNCAPKFDQKVKIPTRAQIKAVCDNFYEKNSGRIFLIAELVAELGKFVANSFYIDVNHVSAPGVDPGDINIAAYYDSQADELCKISIEIVMITNAKDSAIHFDQDLYEIFVKRLADALSHELIHMKQARARDFIETGYETCHEDEEHSEIIYLGNPDEIDAYAYNIVDELCDNPNPFEKLRCPSEISIDDSLNLWVYFNTFGDDLQEPVLRRLLKKIYKTLDKKR